jgi:hypothetical protein
MPSARSAESISRRERARMDKRRMALSWPRVYWSSRSSRSMSSAETTAPTAHWVAAASGTAKNRPPESRIHTLSRGRGFRSTMVSGIN